MCDEQPIPSRNDIDVFGSPDELSAVEHFLGKSIDEAELLFRDNSLFYQEDLMWMGPVAFRFYIHAAIAYVGSDQAAGDSDIIACLASILSFWRERYPAELVPCVRLLADFCGNVLRQFDRYDADPKIYPGLREQYGNLVDFFSRIALQSKTPTMAI